VPTFAAFLRAINVGGHTVRMDTLRRAFESMRFSAVETFIASGNVVFDTAITDTSRLTGTIERKLRGELGYDVATFLRSTTELREIADYKPFPGADHDPSASVYVVFLAAAPDAAVKRKLSALTTNEHEFRTRRREVYWLRRKVDGVPFSAVALDKALGCLFTIRGAPTVAKMADKYCSRNPT